MKEVIFTKGSIYEAVRASVAIPTIFTPAKIGGIKMVDGGIVNPIPTNRVQRIKGDILVASYVNANIPYHKPRLQSNNEQLKKSIYKKKIISYRKKLNRILSKGKKENFNYFTLLNKSTNILAHNLSMMNIGKYNPDIVINVSNQSANTFDFFKAEELIEVGKIALESSIEQYKNNKNEVS